MQLSQQFVVAHHDRWLLRYRPSEADVFSIPYNNRSVLGVFPDNGVVIPAGVACPVDVISSGPWSGLFASAWGCIAAV